MTDAPEEDPPEGLDLLEQSLAWREISAAHPRHPVTPIDGRTN